MEKHTCPKCQIEKPLTDFFKESRRPNGHAVYCKKCRMAFARSPQQTTYRRNWKLKKNYGITQKEYEERLSNQSMVCAICYNPPEIRKVGKNTTKHLVVDHSHETGKVRALLCDPCNVALGRFKTKQLLQTALTYLEEFGE